MATYDNDLRLKEITTGDEDGTWGTSTNTNLALIADGFSLGTKQMAADANETFTMPDATADATRSLYLKITSAVSLTATREVTLGPNTVSKTWIIENATSGSQIITIKQGSGATVNVPNGSKVMVVTDGAGAGAAVFNANPTEVGGTVTSIDVSGGTTGLTTSGGPVTTSGTITLAGTLAVANGGTGVTSSTGTGSVVLSTNPTFAGLTTTADMNFGDNDKAIFGAGNDLEIYSDGANAIIDHTNTGAGALFIKGDNNVIITNQAGTENKAVFASNGAVSLYYDNAIKLATTSTGIDVTGTVVSDAIQVDTDSGITLKDGGDSRTLTFKIDAGTGRYQASGSADHFFTTTDSNLARFYIANNGDISFYEDTGTTPKFFWDASAESLGIGTSSPTATAGLHIQGSDGASGSTVNVSGNEFFIDNNGDTGMTLGSSNTGTGGYVFADSDVSLRAGMFYTHSTDQMSFRVASQTRVSIASSGNVGIGTASPNSTASAGPTLEISGTAGGNLVLSDSNATSGQRAKYIISQGGELYVGHSADDGTSPVNDLVIDSSGNVGIGTNNPVISSGYTSLTLNNATNSGYLVLQNNGTTKMDMYVSGGSVPTLRSISSALSLQAGGANVITFTTNASERMRIQASGNVNIGRGADHSDVTARLAVFNSGASESYTIRPGTNVANQIDILSYNYGTNTYLPIRELASSWIWFSGTAGERARIDTSGNLLVGKTSDNFTIEGFSVRKNAAAAAANVTMTRDSAHALAVNRLTNDGDLVKFYKDSTAVGSIGIESNGFYIDGESAHAGIKFTGNAVIPRDNGVDVDSLNDIGASAGRWKDLYLSGGVYLGGTGAANKLDDYEEGTWTPAFSASTTAPTITYTSQAGTYVKVGEYVYCEFVLILSSFSGGSGHITFTGLPFATQDNDIRAGMCVSFSAAFANGCNGMLINGGSTTSGVLRSLDANNNVSNLIDVSELNGNEILRGSISYKAA
jgi:hypothetical protein